MGRALICEVGGAQIAVWGEPLEWLARRGGYRSVDEMIGDPDARSRFSLDILMFAQEQSYGRAVRRMRG